jgi:bilirubin oxidase
LRRKITFTLPLLFLGLSSLLTAQTALLIPDSLSGTIFDLNVAHSTYSFNNGNTASTMGVNGDILGPTLFFNKGDSVFLNVINNLNEATTMHWHGMHVSPENDGGPHSEISANTTWSPAFEVLDQATTFWYHPHLHEKTMEQVTKGVAGLIIVKDEEEAALVLPRTYGTDDFPLIVQDRSFDNNGDVRIQPLGDEVMVNATFDAYLDVPAQVIRFRILNGSTERSYMFGFSDNRNYYQIGSDGGLLEAPVELNRVQLAPGERAEILVDFSDQLSQTVNLMSYASELADNVPGAEIGPGAGNILNGADFDMLEFRVTNPTSDPITTIPSSLVEHDIWTENQAVRTRTKTFENPSGPGEPFTIDGLLFDMAVINDTVIVEDIEIWELTNNSNSAHPFHIHDIQFYILDRNGVPPSANEQGLKDVVMVNSNETVRFITKFTDFTDDEIPYMYHCHILLHEDNGMMGQFLVIESQNATSTEQITSSEIPSTTKLETSYPNPFNPSTTIQYSVEVSEDIEISIFNIQGQLVSTLFSGRQSSGTHELIWNAEGVASGIYIVQLVTPSSNSTLKLLLVK